MFTKNYDAVEFGKRIRILRKSRKITQETLAEMLFLSVDSISRMENGKGMCMPEHIVHICEIFEVSTEYLYFGEEGGFNQMSRKLDNIYKMLLDCNNEEIQRLEMMIKLFLDK